MADPAERFKSTKDLSMSEKGPYVLLEFSVRAAVFTSQNTVLMDLTGGVPSDDVWLRDGDDHDQLL